MRILNLIFILSLGIFFSSCDKGTLQEQNGLYEQNGYPGAGIVGGGENYNGDQYTGFAENPFKLVAETPVSTFSIDADGASYANIRRFILNDKQLPPLGAVRTEELINYFDMQYAYQPTGHPISLNGEVSSCPWTPAHKLIRIGMVGQPIAEGLRPASNFVFLIDVSGSMSSADKLALLKSGFLLFADQLRPIDRVAIVTYAGQAGLVLPSTSGNERSKIKEAISSLGSGGSTAGAEGILTAYKIALENYIEGGNNRIILGTDGDFNVGVSSTDELIQLIEVEREKGIFLTAIGVGRGNLNDAMLEQLADKGNGTYEYVNDVEQITKIFIHEISKFYTVAKDVKVQVQFNPAIVQSYRLIGYENRALPDSAFVDDTEDAGEIGAGQSITALYEIIPVPWSDPRSAAAFKIDFRYKLPDSDISIPLTLDIFDEGKSIWDASDQMVFASGIAAFAMKINDSQYLGDFSFDSMVELVNHVSLPDPHGYRDRFLDVIHQAKTY